MHRQPLSRMLCHAIIQRKCWRRCSQLVAAIVWVQGEAHICYTCCLRGARRPVLAPCSHCVTSPKPKYTPQASAAHSRCLRNLHSIAEPPGPTRAGKLKTCMCMSTVCAPTAGERHATHFRQTQQARRKARSPRANTTNARARTQGGPRRA